MIYRFHNHSDPLDRTRLRVVLATVFINILAVALLVFVPSSNWRTGLVLNLIDNFILLSFIFLRHDKLMARLMIFGLAVGFAELPADAWLVQHTRTLDYSVGGGPMLWCSPACMPFAWQIVAVQFGYLGMRLHERFGGLGLLLIGGLGALNIPYYEEMARRIHWWTYSGCRMISFTAYYIVLGEFGIAIALALLAKQLRRGSWKKAVLAGLFGGAAIFICYALAFLITDGLVRAK